MKLLIYAYRDWSFENIKPILKYFDYKRWWVESDVHVNFADYDLIITCEPHIQGWRSVWKEIKNKYKVLAMQQSLFWNDIKNPNSAWFFDKFMVWGQLQREV